MPDPALTRGLVPVVHLHSKMVFAARIVHALAPGHRVCGDYVIDGVAPRAAGATVYTAHRLAHPEARYTVRVVPCGDLAAAARFRRGMARAQKIEHRALSPVAAYEVGASGAVVVQRLTGAITLRARLAEGPLAPAAVGWLVCEVAAALDAMHGARPPIVHGALCPGNITLDDGDAAVGLEAAGIADALRAGDWPVAVADALREPGYTSPDEAVGRMSPRADTFVLACIAYECLTGERPFPGDDAASVHAQILASLPPPLHVRRPELDHAVDEVLLRAWRLEHSGSYEGSYAFAMELARALVLDANHRPTWNPSPKHSGMRARGVEDEAQIPEEFIELEEDIDLDEPAPARQTLTWGDVPTAGLRELPHALSVSSRPPPETEPARPPVKSINEPFRQDTLAPPSRYRAWAGQVSRPESPVAPPPGPDELHLRETPLLIPQPPRMPDTHETPVVGTPIPEVLTAPSRTVPIPEVLTAPAPQPTLRTERTSLRAERTSLSAVVAALPKTGLPAAIVVGAALVTAALIVTAGQVYVARLRAAPPRVVERIVTRTVPVPAPAPPVVAAQPPATQPPAPQAVAPTTPPPPAPEEPLTEGPRPPRDAVLAARARLASLVDACVGTDYPGRTVRLHVRYDAATGRVATARVRGSFGRSPAAPCLNAAVRQVTLAPFGEGIWDAGYAFPTRSP